MILFFRSSVSWRRSISCVCSKVKSLFGMVSFTTSLTGWVYRFWFSVISVTCIVCVVFVGNHTVGVRVCLTTVVIAGTIHIIFGLVLISFELMALVLLLTWLFTVVTSWFGFSGFGCVGCCAQYLSAAHLELPNHSVPTLFPDVAQSVHMCHSPNAPD